MYQPGEMTFRSRIPYERLIAFANEADDCHVLMETLALIDDFDGIRRDVGNFTSVNGFAVSGHIDYPHQIKNSRLDLEMMRRATAEVAAAEAALAEARRLDLINLAEWEAAMNMVDEPTTPAPSVPEVPEVSCDLTLCSDDDLWAELARRGLMVNGGEAILINTC